MNKPHTGYSYDQLGKLSLAQLRTLREQTRKSSKRSRIQPLARQERSGAVTLSHAQERLWFLDQLGLVGSAYNVPMALRLEGQLNVAALERALVELIRRHESLRTRFEVQDGAPVQVIDPPPQSALDVRDLSALAESERSRQQQELSSQIAETPFDLTKGPLVRAVLLKLTAREHVLLLTLHHIVCDGWSLGVLNRELGTLYGAYAQGRSPSLPELEAQYGDYAIWQRAWLTGKVLEEHLQYWRKHLEGAPPQVQLPASRPRPQVATFKGARLTFNLPNELRTALDKLVRQEGATLFMAALAAYQVLLSRYSGQKDLIVGSPIAGRTQTQTEAMIGFFVNALILRSDLSGNPTFRQLLHQVREVTLGAYAHQDLPFEKLVKELRPERSLAQQPVFQVALAVQNYPREQLDLPGVTWTRIPADRVTTHFDLTLYLVEIPEGLTATFEYATDLFDAETIERMAGHLSRLLESIVADPDCGIEALQFLGEAEREQVLHAFNATFAAFPNEQLLHQMCEAQAERTPHAIALTCGDRQLTYGELNRKANQLARVLVARGVRPEQCVGVHMERSLEMVIGLLAVLKAGGAYVPLDTTYPAERLTYMLENSAPIMLLTQRSLCGRLPSEQTQVLVLDEPIEGIGEQSAKNPDPSLLGLRPEHLAYVIYTSGSTGAPKGVMVEHRNVVNLVHWHCETFELRAGDRSSCLAALGFDAAVWEMWPPLAIGATLVLAPAEATTDAESLVTWWAGQPLDVSFLPTPMAEIALSRDMHSSTLRTLQFGGDRLRYRPGAKPYLLCNNYGPTESTVVATSGRIRDDDSVLHIGRPIANAQIYILDAYLQPVPIGVAGEIYIAGAGVARGYLHRPDLTQEVFVPNPFGPEVRSRMYRSGDLGRWRPDGTIEYLGRNDHQVKVRGYRIELGEIETRLLQHPQVDAAVVLAREDVPGENRLVAYVVGQRGVPREEVADEVPDVLRSEIVAEWETIYEETYGSSHESVPSFVGWNSSYTDQPIPAAQMREWLDCAVARIEELQPGRLLEIGCGVGLLLQRLAPKCTAYVATDFSAAALRQVRQWTEGHSDFQRVQLLHRSATQLGDLPPASFDTVVLNSVVQYFPDVEYLLAVLRGAVRLLVPGGKIFLGDIRHFGLLRMFHSAVQLSKAAATANVGRLKTRIARTVAQDKELVIDPQFFHELVGRLPGIAAAQVQLKRGRESNELTRYRYDVVLHTGPQAADRPLCEQLDWQGAGAREELEAGLRERRWRAIEVLRIPNARLAREAAAQELLDSSSERLEVGVLRRQLSELTLPGVDPQTFWDWGDAYGYRVVVSPGEAATFDVHLLDREFADGVILAATLCPSSRPWTAYVNDPLDNGFRQQLIPRLRDYLKELLPEYMIPSAWVMLKQLPLTPNGKVDRKALPNPQERPEEMGEYLAPRTDLEQTLAELWAQLLQVDQVGVRDNFFELGGHSLHGMKLIALLAERFAVQIPGTAVFQYPTVESMAELVDSLRCVAAEPRHTSRADLEEGVIGDGVGELAREYSERIP